MTDDRPLPLVHVRPVKLPHWVASCDCGWTGNAHEDARNAQLQAEQHTQAHAARRERGWE